MLRWGFLASRAANLVWDYDSCVRIGMRTAQLARESGTLEALPAADNAYGQAAAMGGDFATASLLMAEVSAVKEATGMRIAPHGAIALAGIRGREEEASELIDRVVAEATAGGQGTAVQYAHWANSVLMNGLGRYEEALAAAVRATEHHTPELFIASWALSELIEAGSRTENAELAVGALRRLGEHTEMSESDWALGIQRPLRGAAERGGRRRAVVPRSHRPPRAHAPAAGPRTGPSALRGVASPGEPSCRRARAAARGTRPFRGDRNGGVRRAGSTRAARDRREGPQADGETRDELTPQERHIAQLARDGLSNPEIGAQLFLSPRTIEWHLRKVFAKLEIKSRGELRSALTDPAETPRLASGDGPGSEPGC